MKDYINFSSNFNIEINTKVSEKISDPVARKIEEMMLVKKINAGIFTYNPILMRVINNIKSIIIIEQEKIGGYECLMPSLNHNDLIIKTNRVEVFNKECFFVKDSNLFLAPTCEEVSLIFDTGYSDRYIFQISNKFRNELRPRGILRTREFLMKDGYFFTNNTEKLLNFYEKVYQSYLNIFNKLGIKKDLIFREESDPSSMKGFKSDEIVFKGKNEEIEIAHLFAIGNYFHERLSSKKSVMGSFGIGILRLVYAIIESNINDKNEFKWPESVSPFKNCFISRTNNLSLNINSLIYDDQILINLNKRIEHYKTLGIPNIYYENKSGKINKL